jgi:hypothetical protein
MLKTNKYTLARNSFQKKILPSPFAKKRNEIDQLVALKSIPTAAQLIIVSISIN